MNYSKSMQRKNNIMHRVFISWAVIGAGALFLGGLIGYWVVKRVGTTQTTTQTVRDTTQTTQDATQTTTQTKLSQEAKTILQIISQNPDMTQKEIAEKLGWKINRVKYHVNRMRQHNIIKRVGTSHKGHWEVV